MTVSVLILTLNEEENLPRCLASLSWCDDLVVLDSFSSDRTAEVARAAGARFVQRRFDNYASQRSYGLNEIDYKHPWVLMLDADEVVPSELEREIAEAISACDDDAAIFRMRRKDFFMGKWIMRSNGYPTWAGRLVRRGRVRVSRAINEEYLTDGRVGYLKEHFLHFPFSKGFHAWFDKHNRYSTMEGVLMANGGLGRYPVRDLVAGDPSIRRRAVKSLVYRIPGRPLIVFLALYVFRGGFLEGRAGFTVCALRAFYEYMINCKVREITMREQGRWNRIDLNSRVSSIRGS